MAALYNFGVAHQILMVFAVAPPVVAHTAENLAVRTYLVLLDSSYEAGAEHHMLLGLMADYEDHKTFFF